MSIGIDAVSNRRTTSRVAETEITTTVTSRTITGTTEAVTIQITVRDIITSEEDIATTRIETTTKRAITVERNDLQEMPGTVKEKKSEYGFGDRCIDFNKRQEFQEQPRYHGDRRTSTESQFEKGCGVAGWNNNEAHIQKPLAPKIQNQENAFQLPTWDSKSPAPSKPYILRARNLEKWNSTEIKGLFQVFNPKKVKKDGDDWLIAFRTQADMDGARIVDGESLPSKTGSKKIIIMKEKI